MIGIARHVLRHLLTASALVLACSTIAMADPVAPAAGVDAPGDTTTRVLGVGVSFDNQGRLIPPPPAIVQQLRAAVASTYAATRDPRAASALDGTRSMVLDERHAAFSIARVDEHGRVATRCVAGADSAEAELAAVAAPRSEEE